MLVPFLKLELCVLLDDNGHEVGMNIEFQQGLFVDPAVYKMYHDVLSMAVQAVLQEVDNAEGK